jgi:hypothetical protein
MASMRGNVKVVPWSEQPRLDLCLEQHLRRTLKDQDPFGPILIIEVAGWARMADRDYALDPETRR